MSQHEIGAMAICAAPRRQGNSKLTEPESVRQLRLCWDESGRWWGEWRQSHPKNVVATRAPSHEATHESQ